MKIDPRPPILYYKLAKDILNIDNIDLTSIAVTPCESINDCPADTRNYTKLGKRSGVYHIPALIRKV